MSTFSVAHGIPSRVKALDEVCCSYVCFSFCVDLFCVDLSLQQSSMPSSAEKLDRINEYAARHDENI